MISITYTIYSIANNKRELYLKLDQFVKIDHLNLRKTDIESRKNLSDI